MHDITPRSTPCYCVNFRHAANTLTKFYDAAMAPAGLTTNQFSLLVDIRSLKSCNKSTLAQYVQLDRTTIIRNLNILQEKGFIETVPGKGATPLVRLTAQGEAARAEGYQLWKQAQRQVKQLIGTEHSALLQQLFAQLDTLQNADPSAPTTTSREDVPT